jgi:hypothetical protein
MNEEFFFEIHVLQKVYVFLVFIIHIHPVVKIVPVFN